MILLHLWRNNQIITMDVPFTYGKVVSDTNFTDRIQETTSLVNNILAQTNTALISPRRWGKSSLVNRAVEQVSKKRNDIVFVRMNAFKCETSQEFLELFAKRVIEDISSSAESLLSNAKEFISRLLPKISLSDPMSQYEISLGVDLKNNPIGEEVLDLPEEIARRRDKKVIVCIDEFQQIGEFNDTKQFQRILRNHWQTQSDVGYILYGSKKHMMLNIFGEYNSPFYKFGDMMFLQKISEEDWSRFIVQRFAETGKVISKDCAAYIASMVECHSYYVQQLAQYSWLRSEKECDETTVDNAFQSMLDSLNLQFVNLMDSLTEKQRGFLCAVCDGVTNLSSQEVLSKYKLGTSGNIRIIKETLKKRDIIDITGRVVDIQDPIFKCWIRMYYNKL